MDDTSFPLEARAYTAQHLWFRAAPRRGDTQFTLAARLSRDAYRSPGACPTS